MKKAILPLFCLSLLLSSCCTVFTSPKQSITFAGMEGTKIYNPTTNMKVAEIGENRMTTVRIKKKREDVQLVAKHEGYKPTPLLLETRFNNSCLWNILFWPGFLVDFGTQQMYKYEESYINIEMEKDKEKSSGNNI